MKSRNYLIHKQKMGQSIQKVLAQVRKMISPLSEVKRIKEKHFESYLLSIKAQQFLDNSYSLLYQQRKQSLNHDSLKNKQVSAVKSTHSSNKLKNCDLNLIHINSLDQDSEDSQLLGKRHKKKLFNKKTVNLLPQLPNLPRKKCLRQSQGVEIPKIRKSKKQQNKLGFQRQDESLVQTLQCSQLKSFNTLSFAKSQKKDNHAFNIQHRQVSSFLLPEKEGHGKVKIGERKKYARERYEPEPWEAQKKSDQLFDINNLY